MACPHQATKLPKTATNCCRKWQQIVARNGNIIAKNGDNLSKVHELYEACVEAQTAFLLHSEPGQLLVTS